MVIYVIGNLNPVDSYFGHTITCSVLKRFLDAFLYKIIYIIDSLSFFDNNFRGDSILYIAIVLSRLHIHQSQLIPQQNQIIVVLNISETVCVLYVLFDWSFQ